MKIIVAIDNARNIGNHGNLLFSIPEDMKFFQEMTWGKVIIMGRKTLESLPNSRPLKNRTNIVLSKTIQNVPNIDIAKNIDEMFEKIKEYNTDDVYVIGGAQIYSLLLPYCDTVLITKIDAVAKEADAKFPELDSTEWAKVSCSEPYVSNNIKFQFETYKRIL